MQTRSMLTAILVCSAAIHAGCTLEPTTAEEEATETTVSAVTAQGWTEWSSGSCGPSGCTTIVKPLCADGSFARAWESNANRTSFRIYCAAGLTSTTNHTWNTTCPAGKVATGVQCITSQGTQFCGPATLRCSTPGGKVANPTIVSPTKTDTYQYWCPVSVGGPNSVGYVQRINYTGGSCGLLF